MNVFKVDYVTTLPKIGNAPSVSITGDIIDTYTVKFYESINDNLVYLFDKKCSTNESVIAGYKQYYTKWVIQIYDSKDNLVFIDKFDLTNKVVFIKMDAYALGDNIAWIQYVDEFRLKHNCTVICSTFHNDLFVDVYPNIMFVKPDTHIKNIYAQYYIGASNDNNKIYSPINSDYNPLQHVASRILGFDDLIYKPNLTSLCKHVNRRFPKRYVTLSEFASTEAKHWKAENGWQTIVDYLIDLNYDVVVISKEKTQLKNVFDLSGDYSILHRAYDIFHSEFHIGVSSGLSWLAWALNKHVVMISDATPVWHEFVTNITRLNSNELAHVDYDYQHVTSVNDVIKSLSSLVK